MSDNQIDCFVCNKKLKSSSILKHLAHKQSCKAKYSEAQINEITNQSKKLSKMKEKAWKKNDYEQNKTKYIQKNSLYRKKESIKSCGEMLQRKFDDFHKTRGKLIENISNNNSSSGILEQVGAIHQMVKVKHEYLKEHVEFAMKNYETHDYIHDSI